MDIKLLIIFSTIAPVLAKIECYDAQGKPVTNGDEFNPKKEDPCLVCRCDMGSPTMCKSVKCGPPSCRKYEILPDKCCDFKCIYTGAESPNVNSTGLPPFNTDVSGSPADSTMTDLGLRLVASTVTTFLILFLLLFLIHRLRQRRLLMTLRRYSRRRDHMEDSDDISYTPDFYGIQCPPYFDPPPPYSPPKPPHIMHGEQPPPYEEVIDPNGNNHNGGQCFTSQQNQLLLPNSPSINSTGVNETNVRVSVLNSAEVSHTQSTNRNSGSGGVALRNNENENGLISGTDDTLSAGTHPWLSNNMCANNVNMFGVNPDRPDRNSSLSVHFRNSTFGQPSITMGVQNRGRQNRNRFSDGCFNLGANRGAHPGRARLFQDHAGLNLELRNALHNYRNDVRSQQMIEMQCRGLGHGEQSSSTTDIGESSTSAESLESSPNITPESPETETQVLKVRSHNSLENLTEDADSTVRQFLDRQFGPLSKVRRYPTTLSQSWTSALHSSALPNFRQSLSLGSFLVGQEDGQSTSEGTAIPSTDLSTASRVVGERHMLRSKSEQLKTNGSLRSPPYKSVVRSQTVTVPQMCGGSAARVSYIDSDDMRTTERLNSSPDNQSVSSIDNCTVDINVSENSSPELNSARQLQTGSKFSPGDIIVTRRQDVLRELRLSHLLNNPDMLHQNHPEVAISPTVIQGLTNRSSTGSMNRSMTEQSTTAAAENSQAAVIISNDAQYPESTGSPGKSSLKSSIVTDTQRNAGKSSIKTRNATSASVGGGTPTHGQNHLRASGLDGSLFPRKDETKLDNSNPSSPARQSSVGGWMSQSWHGNAVESSDDNSSGWSNKTDTLGRNVNTNIEKKTFADKNVSNLFYPVYKHSESEGASSSNRNSVPSSNMRACASQLYNCETEDGAARKEKKKYFLKRHSAGCFPVKRDVTINHSVVPQLGPKTSHKLKGSHRPASHQRSSDIVLDGNKKVRRSSSRDKKSSNHFHHDKFRQFDDRDQIVPVTDLTPSCLMHSGMSSSVHDSNTGIVRSSETPDGTSSRKNRSSGKVDRRSKSLGRNEGIHIKDVEKIGDSFSSQQTQTQSRRKKSQNASAVQGSASFHDELEHVLEHQQKCLNLLRTPSTKSSGKVLGSDPQPCAISHV